MLGQTQCDENLEFLGKFSFSCLLKEWIKISECSLKLKETPLTVKILIFLKEEKLILIKHYIPDTEQNDFIFILLKILSICGYK